MLPTLVYTLLFMVCVVSVSAREVDMSWVQDILKTKEANKDNNRQMAYEIIQGISGNGKSSGLGAALAPTAADMAIRTMAVRAMMKRKSVFIFVS